MPVPQVCTAGVVLNVSGWFCRHWYRFVFLFFFLGASEPRNMAYMNRLGIWGEGTPFREFSDFIQAVERR